MDKNHGLRIASGLEGEVETATKFCRDKVLHRVLATTQLVGHLLGVEGLGGAEFQGWKKKLFLIIKKSLIFFGKIKISKLKKKIFLIKNLLIFM
jgi:hypothetical protein